VLVLGRTDVYDRRVPGSAHATGDLLCDVARLPVGNLTLRLKGDVLAASTRVVLWDGEVSFDVNTTHGRVTGRVIVYGGGNAPSGGASGVVAVLYNASGSEGDKGGAAWEFTPGDPNADAPHPVYKTESYACRDKGYVHNPNATRGVAPGADNVATTEQRLLVGPAYATALVSVPGVAVLATTSPTDGDGVAVAVAVRDARWAIQSARASVGTATTTTSTVAADSDSDGGSLLAAHRAAWHDFYTSGGFLSLPHPRLEQFYWLTQYKMGCGMGLRGDLDGDGGVMDHTAPWFLPNNGLFNWDLNIQMTWWGVSNANRVALVEPLLRFLERHVQDFCNNVVPEARVPPDCHIQGVGAGEPPLAPLTLLTLAGPSAHTGYVAVGRIETGHGDPSTPEKSIKPPGPLGDLVWALVQVHDAWLFSRNESIAKRLYPLLAGAATHYLHWLNSTSSKPHLARVMNSTNFHADNMLGGGCNPLPFKKVNYSTYEPCQAACDVREGCDMWTFVPLGPRAGSPWCCLKSCAGDSDPSCPVPLHDDGVVGGVRDPTRHNNNVSTETV
jgi:hypothetical protein